MSGTKKFDEDKIILLELFGNIMFFDYCNRKTGMPAADELTKAVGLLRGQNRHTLAIEFAAQLHLDIQHILRERSGMAWGDLGHYAHNAKVSLDQNFEFHKNLRIDNWPRENDQILKMIIAKIERWFEQDTFQQMQTRELIKLGEFPDPNTPEHFFFISHPWLCGSLLFGLKLDMQALGVSLLNAWGSAKFAAQIYNATQKEKLLGEEWPDMELALMLYGESAMFLGKRPEDADEYFKRFSLSMGYSAQNFARARPTRCIEEKIISPVAYELRFGYWTFDDSGRSAPTIDDVLQKCLEDNDDATDKAIAQSQNHLKTAKKYTIPEVLMSISESLMSEELALTFDHSRLHRSVWRVLRSIKDANADDLRRHYGPAYLETDNQLPFVLGYIFMTAVQTSKVGKMLRPKKEDVVSSKLIQVAGGALEVMIESGFGAVELKVLRDMYGMEFEVEREGEDDEGRLDEESGNETYPKIDSC